MLRAVTGARSVGSEVHLRNQTSGESIGRTSWIIFKCDFGHLSDFAELTTGAALSGSVKYPQRLSGTLGAHTEEINDE